MYSKEFVQVLFDYFKHPDVADLIGDKRADAVYKLVERNKSTDMEATFDHIKFINALIDEKGWAKSKKSVSTASSLKSIRRKTSALEKARAVKKARAVNRAKAEKMHEKEIPGPPQPKRYITVGSDDPDDLEKMVNEFLATTYFVPLGGINVAVNPTIRKAVLFSQAMVCYSAKTEKPKKR